MNILVININLHSFIFKLYDIEKEIVLAEGCIKDVGSDESQVIYKARGKKKIAKNAPINEYSAAVQEAMDLLTDPNHGAIKKLKKIHAIGFKTIIAKSINDSVLITDSVLESMMAYKMSAPVYNPLISEVIRIFRQLVPDIPLIGVFDTAFHRNMPEYSKLYGVPYEWSEKYNIKRNGFHGSSHQYITERVSVLLKTPVEKFKFISCILTENSSICAVENGKSVDVSGGFSMMEGLMGETSCGDLDPFVIPHLQNSGLPFDEIIENLSTKGGMLGVSGLSGNLDLLLASEKDNRRAQIAIKKICNEY